MSGSIELRGEGFALSLPATKPEMLEAIERLTEWQLAHDEGLELQTEHLIHGGMYVRTVAMPAGMVLTGALIKRPTVVIVTGSCGVLTGEEWTRLDGYNVLPASAGRKQVFISLSAVVISMMFPTQAKTVEEAERDFTDEAERLLSRRQDVNRVVITGE